MHLFPGQHILVRKWSSFWSRHGADIAGCAFIGEIIAAIGFAIFAIHRQEMRRRDQTYIITVDKKETRLCGDENCPDRVLVLFCTDDDGDRHRFTVNKHIDTPVVGERYSVTASWSRKAGMRRIDTITDPPHPNEKWVHDD